MKQSAGEHAFARGLAARCGDMLVALRRGLESPGADAAVLKDEGDRRAHELLTTAIAAAYPRDPVLSEEGVDDPRRTSAARVWIVDPLDGTHEFGEKGRTDWAVHVALVVDGRASVGAVALPALGLTMGTSAPPAIGPRQDGSIRIAVSRTRPPEIASSIAQRLGATLVPMGSAGAKVAAVLLGEVDAYVHGGGQWEWDSAAPVAVALAAGLHASRLNGDPLVYNQPRPWLPDLLVCRAELSASLLDVTRL